MTLLVVDITIPVVTGEFSEGALLSELNIIVPQLLAYLLSFAVLANLWLSHNFLFSMMSTNTTRALSSLNIVLLSFVSLIPFSSALLGHYPTQSIAISFYSIHILIVSLLFYGIRIFITHSPHITNPEPHTIKLTTKDLLYGNARIIITISSSILAIFLSTIAPLGAISILLIPVLLGVSPGLLGYLLRITKIDTLIQ
jgi:uncharacterized membrane protein